MSEQAAADRAAHQEERRTRLGSSDAAAACGVDPYKTEFEAYAEKRGMVEPPDLSDKEAVHFGVVLEDVVAKEYERRTGHTVRRDNITRHADDYPWMSASLDRTIVAVDDRGPGILECKTSDRFLADKWGDTGSDTYPVNYLIQVQHQLRVTNYEWAVLAVLIGGNQFRYYEVLPRPDLIESMTILEVEFWRRVVAGDPPEPDYEHKTTGDLLKNLYPGTDGTTIDLAHMEHWHKVMVDAKARAKDDNAVIEACKNRFKAAMGSAAVGLLPDGTGWRRKETARKGYIVEDSKHMDTRWVKSPLGKKGGK